MISITKTQLEELLDDPIYLIQIAKEAVARLPWFDYERMNPKCIMFGKSEEYREYTFDKIEEYFRQIYDAINEFDGDYEE